MDLNVSNNIISLSNKEYNLLKQNQFNTDTDDESNSIRFERLRIRLEKVERLCEYLKNEEIKEYSYYSLTENSIVDLINESFNAQKIKIENSAKSNLNIHSSSKKDKNGIRLLS